MIQKFNQFINESASGAQNPLSNSDKINDAYSAFLTRAEDRFNMMRDKITEILTAVDKAVETTVEEFGDIIVGAPQVIVAYDLSDIEIKFDTTIPNNDEVWEADDSPAQELERRLNNLFDVRDAVKINTDIYYKPNDEGNCVIVLHTYVIDSDIFGDFTDTFAMMGEDY
jgi:hypothetical protein